VSRYALFAGSSYYPNGGWRDYVGSATDIAGALNLRPDNADWYQIVDTFTGKIVQEDYKGEAWNERG